MNEGDEEINESSLALNYLSNMASSSSEKQPIPSSGVDGPILQHTSSTTADGTPDEEQHSKTNWLSTWIRKQIEIFNSFHVIMAVKYRSLPIGVNQLEAHFPPSYSWQCIVQNLWL